ncbi:MAG: hypothetical protein HQK62_11325 [Desulfamplus sp.]|nr:hypothetical protein [Desulfamplus sp.]
MKIASSQLILNSDRKYEEKNVSKREMELLEEKKPLVEPVRSDSINLSSVHKKDKIANTISIKSGVFPAQTDIVATSDDDDIPADPKLAAMKRMLEAMMGKKLKLTDISGFKSGRLSSPVSSGVQFHDFPAGQKVFSDSTQQTGQTPDEIPARRIRITEFNSHYESEATRFKAQGSVKTQTGESINFVLRLDMKREFYSENSSQLITDVNLTDPLVINFGGEPAELSDVKFKFDLNSDGKDEEISWLSKGSGFLVLDKNQDGVVNDGSELFGPASNNGFNELSELDGDKNGWIDENDAAFEKLLVWSGQNPESADLKTLKQSGIGAIALSSAETEFSIKDNKSQNVLGQIRRTGIYLDENGRAGTIQQLDLAI